MGRPENTITGSGAAADFAQQLRLLREHASLTLRQLADSTGFSTATLSVAASGSRLPTWAVVSAYVQACGGDRQEWLVRWEQTAQSSHFTPAIRRFTAGDHVAAARSPADGVGPLRGLAPLPIAAENTADFIDCLLRVKIWAGDPPVRELSRRTGLPSSTLQDLLSRERRKLPAVEMICAFLAACGVDDWNVVAEWIYAWRRLRFAESDERRHSRQRPLTSVLPR